MKIILAEGELKYYKKTDKYTCGSIEFYVDDIGIDEAIYKRKGKQVKLILEVQNDK